MYIVILIKPNGEELITPLIHDDDLIFSDADDALDYACDIVDYFYFTFGFPLDFDIERI